MKSFRVIAIISFTLLLTTLLSVSCTEEDNSADVNDNLVLNTFSFLRVNNNCLLEDCHGTVSEKDSLITVYLRGVKDLSSLIATFDGEYHTIEVGGAEIKSGITEIDYTSASTLTLVSHTGARKDYNLVVSGYNALPIVKIDTESETPIESKTDYVNANIEIVNAPDFGDLRAAARVRGRGNATWKSFPKKPYKIKFTEKQSPFGFSKNKDWILLADYTDKSQMRTAYMSELSRAVGIDFTINYQHVELYLNGEYRGIYQLTDQVENAKNRVNVEDGGFIIEDDTYYKDEPYYFTTDIEKANYTFKYPKLDAPGAVEANSENIEFITNYVNKVEDSLIRLEENVNDITYTTYIDIEAYAKWYIVAELTGNLDPNLYYVLPSRTSKMKMMPLWDSEWSLGLACKGNKVNPYGWYFYPNHEPMQPTEEFWKLHLCYKYLLKSPTFQDCVKKIWSESKQHIQDAQMKLKDTSRSLEYAQKDNFEKWPILDKYLGGTLIVCGGWSNEVKYVEQWLDQRIHWFNGYINNGFNQY